MKLNNYFKTSGFVLRSNILRETILLCIVSCFFSLSALATNCYDITAGSIGNSQTICTGGDPAAFTNTASATTGQGTGVKYIWLRYVGASAPSNSSAATVISGATSSTYNPSAGSVTAKTWFRRCAAPNSSWCSTYNGESNWVSVSVTAPTALVCEAKVNGTWSTLSSCSVSICTGNSLWLSVNPNVSTVTWTGPNGFTASGNDALISNSIITTNAGTYTAALTQNGCTSTTTIQVIVTSCGTNCNDITAGSIGSNQTICTSGDPAAFTNITAATTGQGTGVKYIWLRYVGATAPSNSSSATVISGATAATYDAPAGSVTAKTWFRRCAAPNSATCTTYNGESSWISVDVTTCGGTCSTISNVYQVTNTHDNCGTNCSDYMMLLPNNGGCFLANSVYLTEYNNGTATLQGTATNSSGAVATINVTLSGKTCTGTPYYGLCITSGGSSWCYYSTMTGTINVAGIGNLNIVSYMHPLQIGTGANLQQNVFGASGWFTVNGSTANAGDFNVNLTSVAAFAATASSTCSGTTSNITLNVSGGRPTYTYSWSNGATTQNLSNLANGTYSVTITDTNGCTTTASAVANCAPNCNDITAGSIGSNQTICAGGDPAVFTSIAATTSQSLGVKYQWYQYVGATAPAATSSATLISGATAAIYDAPAGSVTAKTWFRRVAAVNSATCTTYSGESNWVSVDVITISSGITGASTTCALEDVLFQVVNPDVTGTYSWNFGTNGTPQTATGTNATAQFSTAAVGTAQTVTLTVSKNGCSATYTKSVNVTPEVFANAGPDKEICQGGSAQIGGSPAGPAGGTFTWTPNSFLNSNTVANPIASPPYTTTYTLTTTLNGCTRTDQVVVSVNVALNPNANAGGAKTVCSEQSIQIGGNPTSTTTGVSYIWSPANSLSGAYVANPTAYPTTNTTYTVTVTNSTTGCSATSSAPITVTTCVIPALTINDVTVNENAGTATLQICSSVSSTLPITVTYTTSNGTALSGTDYTATTATATIPAGQTCTNVTFPIIDDNINEPTELFNVTLTNPNGATIADPLGTVTILDNDSPPTCDNITNAGTIVANQSGASPFDPAPLTQTVAPIGGSGALEYKWQQSTNNTTWTDIVGATGISYDPGSLTTTTYFRRCTRRANCTIWLNTNFVTITVTTTGTVITIGDKVFYDENNNGIQNGGSEVGLPGISVNLYNSTGGWLAFASTNANGLYSFSSTSIASLVPGSYRVCFNKPWNFSNVSPKYQGSDDAVDSDVNAINGGSACTDLFTVAAGETKNTVDAGFNNSTTPALPTLTINDITVNENAGTATLQICTSSTSTSPITVTYTTSNGTALSSTDYTATTATATIPAGQTCVGVTIPIIDDNISEPTEAFNVTLSNPNGATIADPLGIVTILDNDTPIDCNDITAGSIGSNQTICTGGDAAAFTSITPATTTQGTGVKYVWLRYEGSTLPGNNTGVTIIVGATGATYDPPAGSVTTKTWFRRCAAPNSLSCTAYTAETNWISVDMTTCNTLTCANITNIYRVQNTLDNCGSSCTNAPYMMILFNQGGCYTANSVYLTEYDNGTAKLQGTATNNTGLTAVIDVTLSGKTCTGTPYYGLCTSGGGASWCYYATMTGTITVAGFAPLNLSSFMHPFQMGNGADLQSVSFGASGWFSSNGVDNQGDFNFELIPVASLSVSTTNVCNGSTGTVTATTTGGRPPYSYSWNNGATTSAINNLANGTYTVTVTDANGCTATTSAVVNCTTGVCDNVTSGGSLGFYQSGTAPFDPSALVETAAPTGGSGSLEYMWQSSNDNWSWIAITGVTSASYDPTAITTSTFYRRGVRRASCSDYLYSNSVYKQIVGGAKTDLSENAKTISNLKVAPVPAIDYINVSFDIDTEQMISVQVLDITGRLTSTQNIITTQGTNMVSFDVTQMLPGYYIVELNNGITKQHAKFIVMR